MNRYMVFWKSFGLRDVDRNHIGEQRYHSGNTQGELAAFNRLLSRFGPRVRG